MSVFTERQNLVDVLDTVREWDFVDPERIFLVGESLGGSVTAITAPLVADRIRGIVLAFPAFCVPADGYAQFPALEDIPDSFEMMGMTIGRVRVCPRGMVTRWKPLRRLAGRSRAAGLSGVATYT